MSYRDKMRAANPRVRPGNRLDGCAFASGPPAPGPDYEHATPRNARELLGIEARHHAILAEQVRLERDREERFRREREFEARSEKWNRRATREREIYDRAQERARTAPRPAIVGRLR